MLRQVAQDLLDQVFQDKVVAARKSGDELMGIAPALHGLRRQLQTCSPAFGLRSFRWR